MNLFPDFFYMVKIFQITKLICNATYDLCPLFTLFISRILSLLNVVPHLTIDLSTLHLRGHMSVRAQNFNNFMFSPCTGTPRLIIHCPSQGKAEIGGSIIDYTLNPKAFLPHLNNYFNLSLSFDRSIDRSIECVCACACVCV